MRSDLIKHLKKRSKDEPLVSNQFALMLVLRLSGRRIFLHFKSQILGSSDWKIVFICRPKMILYGISLY